MTSPTPITPWPYAGDDYSREGCSLKLTVRADGLVWMQVYTPLGSCIESYRAMRPEAVGTAVADWWAGRQPRLDGPYQHD